MRHLGEALDKVRKAEYARLGGKDRRFIKGQKYTLLSRRENLTLEGKRSLEMLLAANKRLNTAYLLKESFGQLWDYQREGWARRFFDNWRASLKWQRLKPYERFAEMIDRHWDGIAAYCKPENKVSLGFVEGLNNKIRVFQRRAYGLTRRGISPPQGTHLHAAAALNPQNHPLDFQKTQISFPLFYYSVSTVFGCSNQTNARVRSVRWRCRSSFPPFDWMRIEIQANACLLFRLFYLFSFHNKLYSFLRSGKVTMILISSASGMVTKKTKQACLDCYKR